MSDVTYLYIVQMDVPAELEDEFDKIYGEEHVGHLNTVPGVIACTRYRLESAKQSGTPQYTTIYEIVSPDVVSSPAWEEAARKGRWFSALRPHTSNKHNFILRKI